MFTYVVLGFVLVGGLLSVPNVANFFQHSVNKLFGPFCIVVGLILLNVFKFNFSLGGNHNKFQEFIKNFNFVGIFLLGIVLGLTFGPVSAALFFGSFTSLALEHHSRLILPMIYGIGTCLPILIISILTAVFIHKSGDIHNNILKFETLFTKITGGIFVTLGLYLMVKPHI